jgi:hypothetical protein
MSAHPVIHAAEYSRSQIQNIVSAVVPKQELFDAQVELAIVHVAHGSSLTVALYPVASPIADSSGGTTWMAPLRIAAVILAGLWALGMATSVSGGFVHALAVIAVAFLLVDFVKNRRVCR